MATTLAGNELFVYCCSENSPIPGGSPSSESTWYSQEWDADPNDAVPQVARVSPVSEPTEEVAALSSPPEEVDALSSPPEEVAVLEDWPLAVWAKRSMGLPMKLSVKQTVAATMDCSLSLTPANVLALDAVKRTRRGGGV